jgi:hypothetical protein
VGKKLAPKVRPKGRPVPKVPSIAPEEQSARDRRSHEAEAAAKREAEAEAERAQRAAEEEQSERDKRREAEAQARREADAAAKRAQRAAEAAALEAARVLAVKEAEREKSRPIQPQKGWKQRRQEGRREKLEKKLKPFLANPGTCSAAADVYQDAYDAAVKKGSKPRKAHETAMRETAWLFGMVAPTEKQQVSASSEDESDDNPDEDENMGNDLLTVSEVRRLLESDIDVNYAGEYGRTALHFAASQGRLAMVKLLLEWGANPNVEDEDGETPLDYADDDDQVVKAPPAGGGEARGESGVHV